MNTKQEIIHARVDKELKDKLIDLAAAHKRSQTNMVEYLIEEAWKQLREQNKI